MVFQHWAEAAGTADLASPLTARPGTVKSFPTTFDSLDDLWQLEKKLLEPPQESVSEEMGHCFMRWVRRPIRFSLRQKPDPARFNEDEADARSQATANETLPRIEGDTFSLEEEPARGQAVNMVRSCLQSSLALKQALQDESIDPYEMKGILRNLGRCSDGGSSLVRQLFIGQEAPFSFHGQLPGDAQQKINAMKPWEEASSACDTAAEKAGAAASTPGDAAHLLTEAGHCLAQLGRAMVMTPVRLGSMSPTAAAFVAPIVFQDEAWVMWKAFILDQPVFAWICRPPWAAQRVFVGRTAFRRVFSVNFLKSLKLVLFFREIESKHWMPMNGKPILHMGSAASVQKEDILQKSGAFPEVDEAMGEQGDRVHALDADEWEAQLGETCRALQQKYQSICEAPLRGTQRRSTV
eukprot:g70.t1